MQILRCCCQQPNFYLQRYTGNFCTSDKSSVTGPHSRLVGCGKVGKSCSLCVWLKFYPDSLHIHFVSSLCYTRLIVGLHYCRFLMSVYLCISLVWPSSPFGKSFVFFLGCVLHQAFWFALCLIMHSLVMPTSIWDKLSPGPVDFSLHIILNCSKLVNFHIMVSFRFVSFHFTLDSCFHWFCFKNILIQVFFSSSNQICLEQVPMENFNY